MSEMFLDVGTFDPLGPQIMFGRRIDRDGVQF